jgi:hypothetical protein
MVKMIPFWPRVDTVTSIASGSRRGQAMVEYVIVAAMLTATIAIMAVFLYSFREDSGRVLDLVSSEFP